MLFHRHQQARLHTRRGKRDATLYPKGAAVIWMGWSASFDAEGDYILFWLFDSGADLRGSASSNTKSKAKIPAKNEGIRS